MSDPLTSPDLKTERATEPPKRWRNKWLLPYAFTGQNTGRIYGPGVEWSSKTWPSRDVAETHAKRQMAIYPLREYLGAYPEGERA